MTPEAIIRVSLLLDAFDNLFSLRFPFLPFQLFLISFFLHHQLYILFYLE